MLARAAWGWSQNDLAAEVEKIRTARGLTASEPESLRRQIIGFERAEIRAHCGARCSPMPSRTMKTVYSALLLTPICLARYLCRRHLTATSGRHLGATSGAYPCEHLFGPDYARDLVDRNLTTIEGLIPVTPPKLRYDVRRAAGRIAELGGWITQDSGDPIKAEQLTVRLKTTFGQRILLCAR